MTTNKYETPASVVDVQNAETLPISIKDILFSFKGRINRTVFWVSLLCIMVVFYGILIAMHYSGLDKKAILFVELIFYVPFLWVSLAIQVKRWHDRDKSGWWVFIVLIPILGSIWAFVETGFLSGTDGENSFGLPCA